MRFRNRSAMVAVLASAPWWLAPSDSSASSHREAPFITKNPKVDGTDFYMFQSYGDGRIGPGGTSQFTTIIANYLPLQDAYGGPNYFSLDPEALYEIHVENSGDPVEDITFQFRFQNTLNPVSPKGVVLDVGGKSNSVPTVQANVQVRDQNGPPITAANQAMLLNVQETYTIDVVRGPRRGSSGQRVRNATTNSTTFRKPVDYIGARTLGNAAAYAAYARAHVFDIQIPGCDVPGARVFVGQRREGFRVNLGLIFDLVNVAPFAGPSDAAVGGAPGLGTITNPQARDALTNNPQFDNTLDKNVTSIALELPTACLTSDGRPPAQSARPIIGGWTTASVRQARVINPQATYARPSREGGAWVQVSRLGMPLTNEVVIGIADKDRFNTSEPKDDAQFADYVTNPTLPQILQAIFGGANVPLFPRGTLTRTDLVSIFLTGVPGVNQTGPTPAEMLRLNTALPVTPSGMQTGGRFRTSPDAVANPLSGLGAAGCFPNVGGCRRGSIEECLTLPTPLPATCDPAGFPNGRRPGDDVVDIELTVLLGYFIPQGTGMTQAPAGGTVLHDAVLNEESQFDPNFPYLRDPIPGSR